MKKILYYLFLFYFSSTYLYANQCEAMTYKGTQCSRESTDGEGYCWQHSRKEEYQDSQSRSLEGFYKKESNSNNSVIWIIIIVIILILFGNKDEK